MCRPSRTRGYDVFPYGPRGADGLRGRARGLPDRCQDQADHSVFSQAIQDPRFRKFSEQNAFLVDDLTGDALDQGSRQRRQKSLGTVAARRSSRTRKNKRSIAPCPLTSRQRPWLPIKKITCHAVAAPGRAALHLLARLAVQDPRHLPRRDRDRRRHRRLGRVLRPLRRREGLHRHAVWPAHRSAAIRSTSR